MQVVVPASDSVVGIGVYGKSVIVVEVVGDSTVDSGTGFPLVGYCPTLRVGHGPRI